MFSIPNKPDAAFIQQAGPDSRDFDVIASALNGHGVIQGCAVTAQGVPNMTVAVAAGTVQIDGKKVRKVAPGNATIGAASATNPRFDLVCIDKTGATQVIAGTPAAIPVFPTITAGYVVLAAVYVPATDTAIDANQIIDKRFVLCPDAVLSSGCARVTGEFTVVPDPLYNKAFNGTAGVIQGPTTADQLGVAQLNSSSVSSEGIVGLLTSAASLNTPITLGAGAIFCLASMLTDVVSDGTNRYTIRVGLGDTMASGTEHANGVFFRYTDNVNAGKWQCVCRAAGVETAADSGVAFAASAKCLLEIEVATDASSATFYINGVQVAQVTTNIPSGTGAQVSYLTRISKSVGTTQRSLWLDKMDLVFLPLNPY